MAKRREQDDREKAARALCRHAGIPENIVRNGRPMWESYLPEADAVLKAIGWKEEKADQRDGRG
jgi:hypothetical protein